MIENGCRLIAAAAFLTLLLVSPGGGFAGVVREADKTFIVDREGYRWEVTQAISLGFVPERFQYGIGKDTIVPLSGSLLKENGGSSYFNYRVIGVGKGKEAQAYSVPKLTSHEIVNSELTGRAIAVGYWPLVDLAAVYSREIDGKKLTIAPSGWTYRSTFVLYDKESMSLWYPTKKGLLGIQGKYFQELLPKIDSKDTDFNGWLKEHPQTKILK